MDTRFELNGITFVWNTEKARSNANKHDGVIFEQAAEAFFDPFVKVVDASGNDDARDAIIGMDVRWNCCLSCPSPLRMTKYALSQPVKRLGRSVSIMKIENLKKRLDRNRPMTTVSIRMPVEVVEDLKRIAPLLGFSGYQPLLRAYVGQGMRADLEHLENDTVTALVNGLKRHGVSDDVINEALSEVALG